MSGSGMPPAARGPAQQWGIGVPSDPSNGPRREARQRFAGRWGLLLLAIATTQGGSCLLSVARADIAVEHSQLPLGVEFHRWLRPVDRAFGLFSGGPRLAGLERQILTPSIAGMIRTIRPQTATTLSFGAPPAEVRSPTIRDAGDVRFPPNCAALLRWPFRGSTAGAKCRVPSIRLNRLGRDSDGDLAAL